MFKGEYNHSIDSKGRVIVPAKFREQLGESFVVTKGLDGCLFGFPNDIAMQVVGVGFIIGVIQDSVETALNSSSDLLLSASAEFRQWRLEGKEILF